MNPLIDLLHLLLCQTKHVTDMMKIVDRDNDDGCYYYLENDISGGTAMYDHVKWAKITVNFKSTLGFASDEEALAFLRRCIALSQEMQSVINGDSHKEKFLKSILL